MCAARLCPYVLPLVAVRGLVQRAMPRSIGSELRLLQRRVAAARLGMCRLRYSVQQSFHSDLR